MRETNGALRVGLITYGCRVNQYESEYMREKLETRYALDEKKADLYIINACTVTSLAERKARQRIHRLRRHSPRSKIVIIGCLADAVAQGLTHIEGVDLLAGNVWKPRVLEVASRALAGEQGILTPSEPSLVLREQIRGQHARIRAVIKVQDGCDFACSFCRTTQVRGAARSKPIPTVLAEARLLVENGYPEITVVGINLAQYASPTGGLTRLVHELLTIEGLGRLRLGSINPVGISEGLVGLFAGDERACPYFHIPLQSGDDQILRRMKRGYTSSFYMDQVKKIRHAIPQATFGADVVVGFPGEDEAAFLRTCELVKWVRFANLHIFRYSPRRGTAAAKFCDQVPEKEKSERSQKLLQLARATRRGVYEEFLGREERVLVEEKKNGSWRGYTRSYLNTYVLNGAKCRVGEEIAVRIEDTTGDFLKGVKEDSTDKGRDHPTRQ